VQGQRGAAEAAVLSEEAEQLHAGVVWRVQVTVVYWSLGHANPVPPLRYHSSSLSMPCSLSCTAWTSAPGPRSGSR
jgi:hypothetical protein